MSGAGEGADLPATPLGTLAGRPGAHVDRSGQVGIDDWSLDWWVGADDRWHLPSREPGARQSLVEDAPVVETRVRVPGGDAVHRAYGIRDLHGHEHVAVEVENASRTPFALALVVRPFDLTGRRSTIAGLEVGPEGSAHSVRADDRMLALLPKKPSRAAGATGWSDVLDDVTSGRAADGLGDAAAGPTGCGPTAALLFPLAHTASIRILLPRDPVSAFEALPKVPALDQIAAGWRRLEAMGTRVDLPDSGLATGVRASRAHLLLAANQTGQGDAAMIAALDAQGFHAWADELLADLAEAPVRWRRIGPHAAVALLDAASRHWALTREDELAEQLLPVLTLLARRATKAGASGAVAMDRFADLLDGIGQPDAADQVRPPPSARDRPADAWARLDELRRSASPTWCWSRPQDREEFLAALRDVLLGEGRDAIDVLPEGIGPWAGQPVELHGAPTAFGPFSFAVRWHGDRPALLWELDPASRHERVVIRAPGLDARWSSDERRGEQLLGPYREDGGGMVDPGESFT